MATGQGKLHFFPTLSRFLLFLLWLFSFTQLGKHFWPSFSLVNGIRVDYLAPTVYLTDIIIVSLIGAVIFWRGLPQAKALAWGGLLGLLFLLPLFWIGNRELHLYGMVKTLELVGLFWAAKQVRLLPKTKIIIFLTVIGGLSLLAIAQFYLQRTIGGGFYWLGERQLNMITPGVARLEFLGKLRLRPYGTFSHPNSLAGFLLGLWWLVVDQTTLLKKKNQPFKWLVLGVGALGLAGLVLTWSQTAWAAGIACLVLVVSGLVNRPRFWILITAIATGLGIAWPVVSQLVVAILPALKSQESFFLRDQLFNVAVKLFTAHPGLGVGLKGFIPHLVDWQLALNRSFLQPVHNGFWLILVESGIVGLLLIVWGIAAGANRLAKEQRWGLWLALLVVILTSANDHYWLTLQQNQLLLILMLSEIWPERVVLKQPEKG